MHNVNLDNGNNGLVCVSVIPVDPSRGVDMIRQAQTFVVATLFLLGMNLFFISQGLAMGTDKEYASSIPFDTASVYFEQNATDGDVEVVFKVSGGDVGLARLIFFSSRHFHIRDQEIPFRITGTGECRKPEICLPGGCVHLRGNERNR
jgi:hypothetical protein